MESLRAGTPQFDEEQQQIFARLRIYIKYQYTNKIPILFRKVTHHLDPEIRKILVKDMFGNEDSTFHSGP